MILSSNERIKDYTEKGFWGTETIDGYFSRLVEASPEKEAVVDPVNREAICFGAPQRLTYRQLNEKVDTMARILYENGIRKDDIVALQLPNTTELIISYLAVLRIGAVSSPFPIQYREYECSQLIEVLEAKAVITMNEISNRDYADMYRSLIDDIPSLEHIFSFGSSELEGVISLNNASKTGDTKDFQAYLANISVTANDIFTICWTSGTEGKPKGVPRSHNEWFISSFATVDAARLSEDDKFLLTFPVVNMAGIGGGMIPWLLSGGTLVLHHPFDFPALLQQIVQEKITYTLIPPALLNMMLKNEAILLGKDISSLRVIGTGSAPLSAWMISGWKEKYGVDIINYFGSNEGAAFLSSPMDIPDPEMRSKYFPRFGVKGLHWDNRISSMIESKIVDLETGEEITESFHPGELRLRGPGIFSGYWKAPEVNHRSFDENGYFSTGDLFEIAGDEERYYRVVGRVKDVIIRGGIKISPQEVEELLQGHPKVAEVAIVSCPDQIMGEIVCACIVPQKEAEIALNEIVDFLREKKVASYKLPERVRLLTQLPRNPVGKVLKNQLREMVKEEVV
ncbi:class I adenylate-forming enzyme family protein [Mesobacillus subterraneus]|uniref:class I adenylate-forming enzyme family protein n=1 Tax=Mesobacillus subterraneus TaxID=285983 RepID=UPI00273F13A2|nr:class I adenylate-forming enzyme family protein [Mesobacillus subterraneus]WLR57335.1 class I adenylate-forming enzyme family protein [Mesobacillus subterraneus]